MTNTPPYVNAIFGSLAENSSAVQIYAPGHVPVVAEVFASSPGAQPFSADWLLFHQQRVPLLAREEELKQLKDFLAADTPFCWWAVHGPAGAGKSRLAFELLRRSGEWQGGFVSTFQQTTGAMSNWTPIADTLWVLDYASAGDSLINILVAFSSRFQRGPHRVRLLLLDRAASTQTTWWPALFEGAGRSAPLLRQSLLTDPLCLEPLGERSRELLSSWLQAAGWSSNQAHSTAEDVDDEALLRATDGGRPLFIAMVAAALWNEMPTRDVRHLLPNGSLDLWLKRELRLLHDGVDNAEFAALSRLLMVTTYAGGLPWAEVPEPLPDGIDHDLMRSEVERHNQKLLKSLSQMTQWAAPLNGLLKLEQLGVSKSSRWALRPDALGERLLHHMLSESITDPSLARVLPTPSRQEVSRLIYGASRLGVGHLEVLARLEEEDALLALTAMARHEESEMIHVMRRARVIAQVRRMPLRPQFLALLRADLWEARHDPIIEEIAHVMYGLSAVNSAGDPSLRAVLDRLGTVSLDHAQTSKLLWVVPFMVAIQNLQGVALYAIFSWLASWPGLEKATTAREVILTLEVFELVANQVSPQLRDPQGMVDSSRFNDRLLSAQLPEAFSGVYRRCVQASARLMPNLSDAQKQEISQRLARAAVTASYVLLAGGAATEQAGLPWLEAATLISFNALPWAKRDKDVESSFLCLRNYLAAMSMLDHDREGLLESRLKLAQELAGSGTEGKFVHLLSDGIRVASRQRDLQAMGQLTGAMIQHRAALPMASEVLKQDNISHLQMLHDLLAEGRINDAVQFTGLYLLLALALPEGVEDGTFGAMAERLAVSALEAGQAPALAGLVTKIEDALESTGKHPAVESERAVVQAMVRAHGVALDRGYSLPWIRVRAEIASDQPHLKQQITEMYEKPLGLPQETRWLMFIWLQQLDRKWLSTWSYDSNTEVLIDLSKSA